MPGIQYIDAPTDVVRIVQLTDTHLCQQRGGTLLGMDTDHSLQAVIDLVQRERDQIDIVLGTGDLSDRGALEAYQRLEVYFDQFDSPGFWLPGNHDQREQMEAVVGDSGRLSGELRIGNWQIVMLDSQVPGEVPGELGVSEIARLEEALAGAEAEGLHTLVCMHHQPVTVGCQWLDEQMVADAETFFSVVDRHDSVAAVLWGHVHQEIDRERNGVRLLASPSTCVQFAPNCVDFKADDLPPGYRWLDLYPNGRIATGVSRVRDRVFSVDLASKGY